MYESLAAHLPAWIESLKDAGKAESTPGDFKCHVRRYITWLDGREPTQRSLFEYRRWMQIEKEPPLRPRTINCALTALRVYFKWLRKTFPDVQLPDVAAVERLPLDEAQRNCPTDEHVALIIQAAQRLPTSTLAKRYVRYRAVAIMHLLCLTGLRPGELLGLRISDVLQRNGEWMVYIRKAKGGHAASQPLSDYALRVLGAYQQVREEWCQEHDCADLAMWLVDKSRPLAYRGLADLVRDLCELAGLPPGHYTPHCFRHWAGNSVDQEMGRAAAQGVLRHRRRETTDDYLHRDHTRERQALEIISQRLQRAVATRYTEPPQLPDSTQRSVQAQPPMESPRLERLQRGKAGLKRFDVRKLGG